MSSLQGKMMLYSPTEEFNLVSDVTNNTYLWRLRLRVIKKWIGNTSSGKEPGLDFIMIDRKGTPIHVKVVSHIASQFVDVFQTNSVYEMFRFNTYKATLGCRPVKHAHMLFLNNNTVVTPAETADDIPRTQKFDFVPLAELDAHLDNQYFIDVIGIITNWTSLKRAASGSVGRDVYIADEKGSDACIQLWGKEALEFDTNNIPPKAVLIVTSAAVSRYEQGGSMKLGLSSRGGTMVHIDLDILEVKALKGCEIEVNIAQAPRTNIIIDWRKGRHSTIQEIVAAFKPYSKDETYIVRARIVAFTDMYNYDGCPTCNAKVGKVIKATYCRKHGIVEHTKQSGFVKIQIADSTGQQPIALFGRQVRDVSDFDIEELVQYRDVGVDVTGFFSGLKERIYLFELEAKTYHGSLSLSASKVELDSDDTPFTHPTVAIGEEAAVPDAKDVASATTTTNVKDGTPTIAPPKRQSPENADDETPEPAKRLKNAALE